jgi:exopolysaccharide production protein ExoQ
MSAGVLVASPLLQPKAIACAAASSQWHVYTAALVVGAVFFITEHSLNISRAEAYTQTAQEMEAAALGGNLVRRLAFFGLAALGLWLLARANQRLRVNLWLAIPVGGYLLVSAASFLWSVDPGMCLRRLIVAACCTLAALGIASRFSIRELCILTLATIGPLVLVGLLAELSLGTFKPWSSDYRFSGSVHPNTQGMHLTALALAAFGLARGGAQGRPLLWMLFAACLALTLLTKSRTGNASTLVAIAAVAVVQTSWRSRIAIGFTAMWAALAGLWLVWVCGYDPLRDFRDALLLGRAEQSDSLSGRAFIWPIVREFISQRPGLGYGFESFWNPAHIETVSDELGWGVREAHDGYLDVLLSTGIVGLTFALLSIAAALVIALRGSVTLRDPAYALPLGMLIFGVLASTMESGMAVIMLPSFFLGCCVLRMALFETLTCEN